MKGILFYYNTRQSLRQLLLLHQLLVALVVTAFFIAFLNSTCSPLPNCSKPVSLKTSTLPKEPTPLDPSSFTYRITSSKESIIYFFKCYNSSYYAERVLPCFLMHVDDLLANTKRHKDPYAYMQSIFSLFHERLTACNWISPIALAWLLEQLVPRIGNYFKNIPSLQDAITIICEDKLTCMENSKDKKNSSIKDKAKLLAQDIIETLKTRDTMLATQMLIVRFLENCFSKLLWDARDDIHAWKSFKLLGIQLEQLYQQSIIPDQATLNHLLWFLVNRFTYWISDLEGSAISLGCYQQIIQELSEDKLSFLHYKEQKQAISSKRENLLKAIETGYTKAYFYHKRGVLTDPLPRYRL